MGRIKGGRRRLRNIGHPCAPVTALFGIRQLCQIDAVKFDLSRFDTASRLGKSHRCQSKRGFSGTGFADQAHDFATPQGQVDAFYNVVPFLV